MCTVNCFNKPLTLHLLDQYGNTAGGEEFLLKGSLVRNGLIINSNFSIDFNNELLLIGDLIYNYNVFGDEQTPQEIGFVIFEDTFSLPRLDIFDFLDEITEENTIKIYSNKKSVFTPYFTPKEIKLQLEKMNSTKHIIIV